MNHTSYSLYHRVKFSDRSAECGEWKELINKKYHYDEKNFANTCHYLFHTPWPKTPITKWIDSIGYSFLIAIFLEFIIVAFTDTYHELTSFFRIALFTLTSSILINCIYNSLFFKRKFRVTTFNRKLGTITKNSGSNYQVSECCFEIISRYTRSNSGVYTDYYLAISTPEGNLCTYKEYDLQELYLIKDFLANFMKIDEPLPDLPFLEHLREKDSSTQKFDEKHQRPKRLWRDMSTGTMSWLQQLCEESIDAFDFDKTREENLNNGWKPTLSLLKYGQYAAFLSRIKDQRLKALYPNYER